MTKFVSPKPFRNVTAVREYLSAERIQCLLCGKRFKSLGQHLSSAHQMAKLEYQRKFRIPRTYALSCPALSNRLSKVELARVASDAEYAARRGRNLAEGRKAAQFARMYKGRHRSLLLPDAFEIDNDLRGMSKADRMAYMRAKLAEPRD